MCVRLYFDFFLLHSPLIFCFIARRLPCVYVCVCLFIWFVHLSWPPTSIIRLSHFSSSCIRMCVAGMLMSLIYLFQLLVLRFIFFSLCVFFILYRLPHRILYKFEIPSGVLGQQWVLLFWWCASERTIERAIRYWWSSSIWMVVSFLGRLVCFACIFAVHCHRSMHIDDD